jgi:hypothetical protein
MRIGVGRLVLAIASLLARMNGAHAAADLFAFAYLTSATFNLYRARELRPAVPALHS